MLTETYNIGLFTLLWYIFCLLKIILIDNSDVAGFQGYRVSQIRHTPVDNSIITLL